MTTNSTTKNDKTRQDKSTLVYFSCFFNLLLFTKISSMRVWRPFRPITSKWRFRITVFFFVCVLLLAVPMWHFCCGPICFMFCFRTVVLSVPSCGADWCSGRVYALSLAPFIEPSCKSHFHSLQLPAPGT